MGQSLARSVILPVLRPVSKTKGLMLKRGVSHENTEGEPNEVKKGG